MSAANLVLQDTVERIYAGGLYADIPRGIFIVRGENVLLLGEIVCPRLTWFEVVTDTDRSSRE